MLITEQHGYAVGPCIQQNLPKRKRNFIGKRSSKQSNTAVKCFIPIEKSGTPRSCHLAERVVPLRSLKRIIQGQKSGCNVIIHCIRAEDTASSQLQKLVQPSRTNPQKVRCGIKISNIFLWVRELKFDSDHINRDPKPMVLADDA